ncbi:c-type heme family protein [Stieleria varia]|uniref:Tll0287-like domain-containing protein n=1 Tax=Stieleria varia TaxID=2528005 RepID=A0A5C6AZA2_9BACT|nr:DUF3365 domain-containing protein [Stieleria varia]TWU04807.1 hypothetical protein Pla52n_28510 [Stieleria varia]
MRILFLNASARFLFCACVLFATGCSSKNNAVTPSLSAENNGQNNAADSSAVIVEGQSPSEASKARMLAAKDALFTKLSGKLMDAMASEGPAAAIAVCQQEAPAIAKTVGEEQGLLIGRTGVRLRNQSNVAPSWAAEMVRDRVDTPTFVTLDNGHSAALLPIKLQAQCLMCHGPQEDILPEIKEQLTRLYPDDQATGFKEGELRGWFWIDLAASNE